MTGSRTAVLRALAGARPPGVLPNAALAARLDTSDEWITTRTGIAARHWAGPHTSTGDLAVTAGAAALALSPGPVDAVLVCTTTPDHRCPATAPAVADRLGLAPAAAFDVGAACSGFLYGLACASGLLATGLARRVLVVAAETLTRIVDPTDRQTAIVFGDGAGAAVLEAGEPDEPGALAGFDLGSDGAGAALLVTPAGGARTPLDHSLLDERAHLLRMDGRAIYREAVHHMTESSGRSLRAAGLAPDDVARVVAHQANLRIVEAVMQRLGLPADRAFNNIDRYGNTSAASIPLALCDLGAENPPATGAHVLLTAFGAGLTWSSAVLRWLPSDRIAPVVDHHEEEPHPWTTCTSK